MIAAGVRVYPFHGRLILELVPAFFVIVAQGTEWIAPRAPGAALSIVYKIDPPGNAPARLSRAAIGLLPP